MWEWMLFWRRKPPAQGGTPDAGEQQLLQRAAEHVPALAEGSEGLKPELKTVPALIVVERSGAAARLIEDQPSAKPMLVVSPKEKQTPRAEVADEAKEKKDVGGHELTPVKRGGATAIGFPDERRVAYFTRGSYAPSAVLHPQLVPRDSPLRTRCHRSFKRLTTQVESDGAFECGSSHPPSAQK